MVPIASGGTVRRRDGRRPVGAESKWSPKEGVVRKRLFRFRRVAVAALTGTTVVTGMTLIGVGAGTASASTSATVTVGADAPVPVAPGFTESVGNLYATFTNNWTINDTLTFEVQDHFFNCSEIGFSGTGTVTVTNSHGGDTTPTFSSSLSSPCGSNSQLNVQITNTATGTASDVWDITISGLHYNIQSDAADGNVAVSAQGAEFSIVSGAGSSSLSSPSGTSAVSNADVIGIKLGADEPTNITAPGANQTAGDFLGSITNSFIAGAGGNFQVIDNAFDNCDGTESVGFAGTPTVTVTPDPGNSGTGETAPTITATYSSTAGACTTASIKNVLTFTVTNNATGLTTGDLWDINVSGVEYTVGAAAATGSLGILINNADFLSFETGNQTLNSPADDIPISNAIVSNVVVGANSPPVAIDLPHSANNQAANQPISDITLTEQSAGLLPGASAPDNWICVSFENASIDTSTSVPSVSVDAASGATVGTLSVINNGDDMVFQVTTPSTTAATYTISGVNVDTNSNGFDYVFASMRQNSACSNDGVDIGAAPAFYAATTHPLYGALADDTAAAELQYQKGNNGCLDNTLNNSVDLARDDLPYDSLSGAYLAGRLNSGTLLTPGGSATTVSNSTLNALRIDGAQTVYVLGGPLAISNAIVTQLQNTQAYDCGGNQTLQQENSLANPVFLNVIRIWGNSADDTASAIGQYMGTGSIIGKASFSGAWGATYNDTGSLESAPPVGFGLRTAIVAQDAGWQDAASAGPISWDRSFPIFLTTPGGLSSGAQSGLANDNIEQVIVMGGQLAVSDTVVQQIESLGIAVLRIAGHDFTDTSQLTAVFAQSEGGNNLGPDGLGWGDADPYVARGDYFGDALAGAGVAGNQDRPILLSASSTVAGAGMTAYFDKAGLEDGAFTGGYPIQVLRILGGPLAFTQGLIQTLLNDIAAGNDAS